MIWVLSVAIFSAGFVPSFKEMSKGNGTIGMFETLQNPAMISIIGPTPIETAKDYTLARCTHMKCYCFADYVQ